MSFATEFEALRASVEAGDVEAARTQAGALAAGLSDGAPPDERAAALEQLAGVYAELDDREAALGCLRNAREQWRASGRQPHLLRAYACLGARHLAWDQHDEAESAYRTAIQQARIWGNSAELGLCLLGLGRTLRCTDRSDRALLAYTEAVACLAGHDEGAHAEAVAELRSLGRVPGGAR